VGFDIENANFPATAPKTCYVKNTASARCQL